METANLEYDNLKKIVDFCNDAKVMFIVFTGGEPTLYPQLIDILQYIKSKEHKMLPTIATNGIELEDMQYCKTLIDNGIGYIDISLLAVCVTVPIIKKIIYICLVHTKISFYILQG